MESFTNTIYRSGETAAKVRFSNGLETDADAPPKFGGKPGCVTPEELFVASVNACLMMAYYYVAGIRKIGIASYESEAEGTVEKGSPTGGMWFTGVKVRARIKPENLEDADRCRALAESAEKYCIVSATSKAPVDYAVEVVA
jgi:organic hydroperoxide reductase OsmC/OhrA